MPQFKKKPVIITADRWFKNGDHPLDYSLKRFDFGPDGNVANVNQPDERKKNGWEGDIVRYYRHPDDDGERKCQHCGQIMHDHGWIDTLEGGHNVCPGDWIITGIKGEMYPCKNDIFLSTYEKI